ncbi:5-methyltetrahydropteroyltriglutamate--homocysteine S-methyltransferase [bacterium]|nr:5-methyltetrahydropteroyltriglutamate--homocysteine S-methyltransferase [bacterium]MBU1982960.1 5-methyltetrahydropteroyltriglutamate--homocysteine S-methyltransferase [bacterium]
MVLATNLGFPRIGPDRELKKTVEKFWSGKASRQELLDTAAAIRRDNWLMQKELGLDHVPCGDFSLYDHMLDTLAMLGAVPKRYGWSGDQVDLDTYFAMARGSAKAPAMEMTKWFDTNYHYIVPEFERGMTFHLASTKLVDEYNEAKSLGIRTRPVLLGPVSFLHLGKSIGGGVKPLSLLDSLLEVYIEVLRRLADAGAGWVQIDEPCLVLDLPEEVRAAFNKTYSRLAASAKIKILLTSYFDELRENLDLTFRLPVAAVHLDLVRAPQQLEKALAAIPQDKILSLGVVDGRNVWRSDLDAILRVIRMATEKLGKERVFIAPSCSLLHSPVDLDLETGLDDELRSWMAFAKQKVHEIVILARAVNEGEHAVAEELKANREAHATRRTSKRIHNPAVKERVTRITPEMFDRPAPFAIRRKAQETALGLPPFPTTTIGSFPQTKEIRAARADFNKGKSTAGQYKATLRTEIEKAIRFQEEIGLDVLVHGESERSDMVEYFGEQLEGFAFTRNGWVQSYGSRCVRPPVIFGDVSRPEPMTVAWSKYAQSLTRRPVKGMLTGPVTILQWSFVRDDQPRKTTCEQIALAILDEVLDLEAAGIKVIQIDEPAIREGLPLRRDRWNDYLTWAVNCFRLSAAGAKSETQIHTHMCYSEFNDIIAAIGRMDADVISIESSRSKMELLAAFKEYQYPNDIGPGVYDIHSPRVPTVEEMEELLRRALQVIAPEQLWVNPDCGLKTRSWEEVRPALKHMVDAARRIRM